MQAPGIQVDRRFDGLASQGHRYMHPHSEITSLEVEIQAFTATLKRCFGGERWDVVRYYAERTWFAADAAGTTWPEVESRVHAKWNAGVSSTNTLRHDGFD